MRKDKKDKKQKKNDDSAKQRSLAEFMWDKRILILQQPVVVRQAKKY